jgi:hypothetical protein
MAPIRKLGERRYQARWVDPDGRECSKIFSRRTDAEDKIKEVEHSKLDGCYIDHKNPITVAPVREAVVHNPSSSLDHRDSGEIHDRQPHCRNPTRR